MTRALPSIAAYAAAEGMSEAVHVVVRQKLGVGSPANANTLA
jgi:hypothetical protein